MPNWCMGTLKIRGKQKDVKRFVLEGLRPVDFFGNEKEPPLNLNKYNNVSSNYSCYIEGTCRGFVEDLDVYFDGNENAENIICKAVEAKFAWGIDATEFVEISKKYGVDFRIHAFERGMEFNQDIEIIAGEIVKDEEIKFNDYTWECICPNIGG